jgi:hypothetical protein
VAEILEVIVGVELVEVVVAEVVFAQVVEVEAGVELEDEMGW